MKHLLEIIGFNIESCIAAQEAHADRIELCDNQGEGGTTPSYGFIKIARQHLTINLFPIIRPRGGDFFYNDAEFEMMKTDILCCKKLGCDGIVTGILNADSTLDLQRNKQLVELAYPMNVTLHRAFDHVNDGAKALEVAIECGFERILTSGFVPNAIDGVANLKKLVAKTNGRIIIMPGSGVRAENIEAIAKETGANEFHSSAKLLVDSKMKFHNPGMNEDLKSTGVDVDEIKMMKEKLSRL